MPGRDEDERMVDFVVRWLPYGGGPAEDIVVGFGISPREFFTRLDVLLRGPACPQHLDRATVAALLTICSRRSRIDQDAV
ncbi:hypothetical protein BJF84_15900 [Rhodococcus sp. CUA-806]|nr:hypothetical protein BJF84_15900 [Rhodococcus sp. CUA-806]